MVAASGKLRRAEQNRARDTRTLILDAAVQCLNRYGYAGTTTLLIQQCAGVSRGRMLHHFPSRTDLLAAASRHLVDVRAKEMVKQLAEYTGEKGSGRERVEHAVELTWSTFHHPYFWAAMELWLAARIDAELRAVLTPHEYQLGATIRATLDQFFGPEYSAHPRYRMLCELLFTSMRGVTLTHALTEQDPATDRHLWQWKEVAVTLLDA